MKKYYSPIVEPFEILPDIEVLLNTQKEEPFEILPDIEVLLNTQKESAQ